MRALLLLWSCTRLMADLGPVGQWAQSGGSWHNWDCVSGGIVTWINSVDGQRINTFQMNCNYGPAILYHGSCCHTPLVVTNDNGYIAVDVTWDQYSICSLSFYSTTSSSAELPLNSNYQPSGAVRFGGGCDQTQTLSCPVGQKITGFYLFYPDDRADAIYNLGLHCSPAECTNNEIDTNFCSCLQPGTYQSGVICYLCVDTCSTGQYLSGCGGRSRGTCAQCSNAASNAYYTGNGNQANACPTAVCGACPAGQQRTGCGGLYPGTCAACGTPTANGYYYQSGCSVVACPAGTYAAGTASTACVQCPSNSYSLSQSSACVCNSGYYGSPCAPCAAGYICSGGNSVACSAGQYSTGGAVVCSQCLAGTYSSGSAASACAPCQAGSFSLSFADSCSLCGPSTYSAQAAAFCPQCQAGTYSSASNASACALCAPGTYSLAGSLACSACGKGMYNTAAGASSPNLCSACPPGTYGAFVSATACALCPPGTASNSYGTMEACGACLPSSFAPNNGSKTCIGCSQPQCGAGAGFVACTSTTDAFCTQCPAIKMCTYTSAGCSLPDGSPACACPQGYQLLANACQLCPSGQFKPLNNTARCGPWSIASCPAAMYLANGTPYQDAQCLPCPPLPTNAVRAGSGCAWKCGPGFNTV